LSYEDLIQQQKLAEGREKEYKAAQQEYRSEIESAFTSPVVRISAFRPHPSTKRARRAIALQRNLGELAYPFPEDSRESQTWKKVYFPTGRRIRLARFRRFQKSVVKRAVRMDKEADAKIVRIAKTMWHKENRARLQAEYGKTKMLEWKEGDPTYVLPITTGDIEEETPNKISFKQYSETQWVIQLAGKLLREECIVAFPTETVYGLGANALSSTAIQKIYKAKNRPSDNPLILHFGSLNQLKAFSPIPEIYNPLIKAFWPGPLTILLPVTKEMGISSLATAGLDTVAVRIPSSPLARALIQEANVPIAAPSANASTRPSPTLAEHVFTDLNERIPVLLSADEDIGSQCDVGLESTVVDGLSKHPTILRLGGTSLEAIQALGGAWRNTVIYKKPRSTNSNGVSDELTPRTPGMKYRHYSPSCPVIVYPFNCPQPLEPSALLPRSDNPHRKIAVLATHRWEPKEDPGSEIEFNWLGDQAEDVARNLFKCIRDVDEWGAELILVEGIESIGLGRSVMERLGKMSSGND
jgi:L-threonylcarbamoyladenylate synthase